MGSRSYSTLSDVADVIDSLHITPKYSESGYPMVRCVNIAYGSLNLSETKRVTEEVFKKYSKKYSPKRGDIIITRVGANFGETAYVESTEFCLGQNTAAILPKGIDPDYLYFILNSSNGQHQMDVLAAGAAQPTLSIKSIKSLQISRLGEEQEKWIADNISQLNDKIQLNRQTNQTLEQLAQALFKSWFVDFDPVIDNALAAGNSIPDELQEHAQRRQQQLAKPDHKPLPDDIRQLFPSEFELTEELGWVPMGWEVNTVENIVTRLKAGKRYAKKEVSSFGQVPVYEQGQDILLGYHNDKANFRASVEEPMFIFGDHTCVTRLSVEPFSISANVIPLKGKIRSTYWTYFAIKDLQSFEEYRRHWMELAIKPVIIPSIKIADSYSDLIRTYTHKTKELVKSSGILTRLRDTLLPKLISGELRLPSEALANLPQQPTNAIV